MDLNSSIDGMNVGPKVSSDCNFRSDKVRYEVNKSPYLRDTKAARGPKHGENSAVFDLVFEDAAKRAGCQSIAHEELGKTSDACAALSQIEERIDDARCQTNRHLLSRCGSQRPGCDPSR